VSLCHKNLCTCHRQCSALLFYIILLSEQQCVAGNIITNSTVFCLMNVCSCFLMDLKLYIFSAVTHSWSRWCVVLVWRVATLPMSCYIVRDITNRIMPQIYAGYLRTSQSLVALWGNVSTEFPFCSCSNLWYLRVRASILWRYECENRRYVGWSPSIVDKTEAK